jgi:integrase
VHTLGKGRKERRTPLVPSTIRVLEAWLRERGGTPADPLFPTSTGRCLSRDAVERRLAHHVALAGTSCPSITAKRVTMHTLRHYVDGWVMWLAAASPLVAEPRVPVPAT